MSVFGWIIIQQHIGNSFNWQLPWADYKAGFGSIDADFWLGLEQMHLMTSSQAYRLRVEVLLVADNLWYSAEYWSFQIGDQYWSRSVTSTGDFRSVTKPATNTAWKCLDTVEMLVTHSSMTATGRVMACSVSTSTTA